MTAKSRSPDAKKRQARKKHVYHRGKNVIIQEPKKGTTIHVPSSTHEPGLNRLINSRRFPSLYASRDVEKKGIMQVLFKCQFGELTPQSLVWIDDSNRFVMIRKLNDGTARMVSTDQIIHPEKDTACLLSKTISYSFTLKQNPETVTQMATKKKAASKKAATKKAVTKKAAASSNGKAPKKEGKIFKILELHKKGLTNAEIVDKGFNKGTVAIQVSKFKKANGSKKKATA